MPPPSERWPGISGKTGDTKLQSQLNMLMKDKAIQAVRLINSLLSPAGYFCTDSPAISPRRFTASNP